MAEIVRGIPQMAGCREQIAQIYYGAFERKLAWLLVREELAIAALAPSLTEHQLVALEGQRIVGVAGLRTRAYGLLDYDRSAFRYAYGRFGGWWRRAALRFADHHVPADTLHVDALAVAADRRGHGIGAQLVAALCAFAIEQRLSAVTLEVVDVNPRAQSFYEQQGFEMIRWRRMPLMKPVAGFGAVGLMRKQV